jgi:Transposase, Mutator family
MVQLCAAAPWRWGMGQHLVWAARENAPCCCLSNRRVALSRPGDRGPGERQRNAEPQRVDCVRIVHFLRNALDYVPRKVDDDCLQELRWIYDRRDLGEARQDLAAWLSKWQGKYPKLTGWVEEAIEETLTFYRLPRQHHKHLKPILNTAIPEGMHLQYVTAPATLVSTTSRDFGGGRFRRPRRFRGYSPAGRCEPPGTAARRCR